MDWVLNLKAKLLVGTRGSRLALAQTDIVLQKLRQAEREVEFTPIVIRTVGDDMPPEKLGQTDGKTAFTGELDRGLVEGRIDIAVHSMKDVPSEIDGRLVLAGTPSRGDPRDAFVSGPRVVFERLPPGSRIGTSSIRRRAQLARMRKDVELVELHGNVDTRLRKVGRDGLAGAVLAAAGLQRLGLGSRIDQYFETEVMIPAVCQGTLAVIARKDDKRTLSMLGRLDDPATRAASECERAFSAALGGDCNVPLGGFAKAGLGGIAAIGMVADPTGERMASAAVNGPVAEAKALGESLAERVAEAGGDRILRELGA